MDNNLRATHELHRSRRWRYPYIKRRILTSNHASAYCFLCGVSDRWGYFSYVRIYYCSSLSFVYMNIIWYTCLTSVPYLSFILCWNRIPSAVERMGNVTEVYIFLDFGFLLFLAIEQFLHWHHSHTHIHRLFNSHAQHPSKPMNLQQYEGEGSCSCRQTSSFDGEPNSASKGTTSSVSIDVETPLDTQSHSPVDPNPTSTLSWLILLADGLHNLIGGMFVGASFLDSIELGLSAWVAAAAHEVPQEVGCDVQSSFAILSLSKLCLILLSFSYSPSPCFLFRLVTSQYWYMRGGQRKKRFYSTLSLRLHSQLVVSSHMQHHNRSMYPSSYLLLPEIFYTLALVISSLR